MRIFDRRWALPLGCSVACWLAGCSSEVTPIQDCVAAHRIEPICEFHNPEDLVLLPDGGGLVVSQAPQEGLANGTLVRYQPSSGAIDVLFPGAALPDQRDWGEADCEPPIAVEFAPHGIDLVARDDGQTALVVINHGGPETVEYFAVGADGTLSWRGCVTGPEDAFWNDLIGLPGGGFMATQMMPKSSRNWSMFKGLFGFDTGRVDAWSPGAGFSRLAGTAMPFPNGIERSPDGRFLFVASYLGGELRKIELATGETVGRLGLQRPDNLTWASDGRLLVAGVIDTIGEVLACGGGVVDGGCGAAFEVVAVDPESMRGELVLAHRGAPMGGVSVALEVGNDLYLGSFAGDRIARWRWRDPD
jgi:sugar lactone lactonase YvrE